MAQNNILPTLQHKKRKEVISYAQNKRQKNRSKTNTDYASQIAEKQETIASLNTEIASITANLITFGSWVKELMVATPFLK